MRDSWTDERLDYLNHRVDDGFERVDERFGHFERRVDERFDEVNRRMQRLESELEKLNENFAEWVRSSALTNRALIVTVAIGFLTVLVTHG